MITVNTVANLATARPGNGDIVRTRGYSVVGIGENEYRYDRTSSEAIDNVFVINGPGGRGRYIATDREVVDVTKAGAIGNGVADDSVALQRAVDAMPSLGGVLFLPQLTYIVDNVAAAASIVFSGMSNFKVIGHGATIMANNAMIYDDGTLLIQFVSCTDFTVEGLTVDGNRANRTPVIPEKFAHSIAIDGCSRFTFDRVRSVNAVTDGFYVVPTDVNTASTYPRNGVFQNCSADNCFRQGMSIIGAYDIEVNGGSWTNTNGAPPEAAIDIEADQAEVGGGPVTRNIVLKNLYVAGNAGAGIQVSDQRHEAVLIDGCEITDNAESAILLGGNTTVRNCNIHSFSAVTGDGVVYVYSSAWGKNIVIEGTMFHDITVAKPCIYTHSAHPGGVRILNNTADNVYNFGIFYGRGTTVIGNRIAQDTTLAPIYTIAASGDDQHYEANVFQDFLTRCIYQEGLRNKYLHNTFLNIYDDTDVPPGPVPVATIDAVNGSCRIDGNVFHNDAAKSTIGVRGNAASTIELSNSTVTNYAVDWVDENGGTFVSGAAAFTKIATPGQSDIDAGATLTITAGNGIALTTDALTDTLTVGWPDLNITHTQSLGILNDKTFFMRNAADDGNAGFLSATAANNVTLASLTSDEALQLSAAGAAGLVQFIVNSVVQGAVDASGINLAAGKTFRIDGTPVGGGLPPDADYGDITITGGVWTIDAGVVTYAKMQDISATSRILGRIAAGAGDVEELTAANVLTIIGVEAGADVTDATNVAAAGAVMEADTSTALMQFVIDEDTMVSDLATKVPTQQSVKAYVDTEIAGVAAGGDGTFTTLTVDSATPDVTSLRLVNTANTVGTAITNLPGGTEGQYLEIHVNDANTSFVNNSNLALIGGVNIPASSSPYIVALRRDATQWRQEGYASLDHQFSTSADGSDNLTLSNSVTDADININVDGTAGLINLDVDGTDRLIVSNVGVEIAGVFDFGTATIQEGTGTPEAAVTANIGSLFLRTDGGAGTSAYIKESGVGNTGWVAIASGGGGLPAGGTVGDLVVNTGSGTGAWSSVVSVGANGATITGGTVTNPAAPLAITQTWNDAADTMRGIEMTITDTASAAASTGFRVLGGVDGTTNLITVNKSGIVSTSGAFLGPQGSSTTPAFEFGNANTGMYYDQGAQVITFRENATNGFFAGRSGAYVANNGFLGFPDTFFLRVGAGHINQRPFSGTRQELFSVASTSNTTNFERVTITKQDAGSARIYTEKGGSGTARELAIGTDATDRLIIAADGTESRFTTPLVYQRLVEANTAVSGAPNALATTESNKVLTNEAATAANYHTLPAAAAGLTFTFIVADGDGMRIVAGSGDSIRLGNKVTAAAGYVESTTIGDTVTIMAINGDEWVMVSGHGTWTDGTFTWTDTSST